MKYTDISRGRQADFDEAEARYQKQLQDSDTRYGSLNVPGKILPCCCAVGCYTR